MVPKSTLSSPKIYCHHYIHTSQKIKIKHRLVSCAHATWVARATKNSDERD